MAIKKVVRMGDPVLKAPCLEVSEFDTPELHALVVDMKDTMHAENGAGLAANQIGVNLRVILFGFEQNERYPEAPEIPETVLINPIIEVLDRSKEIAWEGCLSIPGMRGLVPRYLSIRYSGKDEFGNPVSQDVSDFHARVVQHENDHLDGLLYPQRMTSMDSFGYIDELDAACALDEKSLPCEDDRSEV